MFRIVSLSVVLTLIIVLGITFFRVIAPFLLPLFLAGVMTILIQPLFKRFIEWTNGRVRLSAGLTTTVVVMAILGPLVTATALASVQLYVFAIDFTTSKRWETLDSTIGETVLGPVEEEVEPIAEAPSPEGEPPPPPEIVNGEEAEAPEAPVSWRPSRSEAFTQRVTEIINDYRPAEDHISPEMLRTAVRERVQGGLIDLADRSLGMVAGVFLSLVGIVVGTLVFAVAIYYFLADGPALLAATEKMIPVHIEYQRQMIDQFARVVRSVVSATFLSALAQAVATTAALWMCGFGHLPTLFILSLLASMIPMAGAWLVWLPCAAILAWGGDGESRWTAAILLTVYGTLFVGLLDNLVRTYVLNTDIKLHPLLGLISVLGGLQVLGLWGVFIGPIVASCLHALVKIFNLELMELSRTRFGERAALATEAGAVAAVHALEETPPPAPETAAKPAVPPTAPMKPVAAAAGRPARKRGKKR